MSLKKWIDYNVDLFINARNSPPGQQMSSYLAAILYTILTWGGLLLFVVGGAIEIFKLLP